MVSFEQRAREDFHILRVDISEPGWIKRLFDCLKPPFVKVDSKLPYGGQASMENLLNLVEIELKGQTAIIEPYVSTDWNSEYSEVYSRIFADIPMFSQRIHFFKEKVGYSDLRKINEKLKKSYLGYTVVRPLHAFRVGDTVIISPCAVTDHRKEIVHCQEEFTVSLLGNELKVRGMPFIQQDTTVGVCAEADLWMVARYLNKKGEIGRFRPAEITKLANATITTGPGREGLFDFQMMDALRRMRLNPIVLYPTDANEAKTFIYTCIESGLPIITGIPGHVYVVIGHDYYENKVKFPKGVVSISEAVDAFIVHDDSRGPYKRLEVGSIVSKVEGTGKERELLTLGGEQVDFFMVALPQRVHMNWKDAWDHTALWLDGINLYAKKVLDIKDDIWLPREMKNIVTRTYLRLSSDFKYDVGHQRANNLRNSDIIKKYLCMEMPKYVWVVELARPSDLKKWSPYERKIRGEIVLDSTASRHVPEEALLSFHLNGRMFIPKPEGKAQVIVQDDIPYDALMRCAIP